MLCPKVPAIFIYLTFLLPLVIPMAFFFFLSYFLIMKFWVCVNQISKIEISKPHNTPYTFRWYYKNSKIAHMLFSAISISDSTQYNKSITWNSNISFNFLIDSLFPFWFHEQCSWRSAIFQINEDTISTTCLFSTL